MSYCSRCGYQIDGLMVNCPACGHALNGSHASSAVREFALKIERIEAGRTDYISDVITATDQQIISLIRSFPVPSTREDIFEFANLASANIDVSLFDDSISDNNARKAISKAWKSKLNQVYNKAIIVFDENDEHFIKIKRLYDATQYSIQRQRSRQKIRYTTDIIVSLSGSLVAIILLILGAAIEMYSCNSIADIIILVAMIVLVIAAGLSGRKVGDIVAPIGAMSASGISILIAVISNMAFNNNMSSNYILLMGLIALIVSVVKLIKKGIERYNN